MNKSAGNNDTVTVAIIQHPPVFLNLRESIKKAISLTEDAANKGAQVIAFPETWLPGYPTWLDCAPNAALWGHAPAKALYRILSDNSLSIPGKEFDQLRQLAGRTGCHIVISAHEKSGGTLYNTLIYFHRDGEQFEIHRKLVPTYTERLVWGRGDGSTLSALETDHGVLGGLICWEHWMPLARAAMHATNETIHVAQWPWVHDLHQLASRHYAFEGQCFVLACGTVMTKGDLVDGINSHDNPDSGAVELLQSIPGDSDELLLKGGSAIIAPDSTYVTEPLLNEKAIITARINLGLIAEGHMTLDTAGHYSRPDIFELIINDHEQSGVILASDD